MRRQRKSVKFLAVLAGVSLVAAACGGDDDDGADDTPTTAEDTGGAETEDTATDTGGEDTATDTGGEDTATDTGGEDTATDTGDTGGDTGATEYTGEPGEVGGSGCGMPHGPYEDKDAASGEVRVAWNDPLLSFNNNTLHSNALANTIPLYFMQDGFNYYDGELNLVNNDNFGLCIIESLDPLTITYRIRDGVTWSDGVQVDAADLILNWAALSGVYNTAEPEYDEETGELITTDEIAFDAFSQSLSLVTEMPVVSDDGLAVTATWDTFYVDFPTSGLAANIPAHIVAKNALGIEDPAEAKQALLDAFANNDAAAIKPISDFYNTGFDYNRLPDDPDIYIGHGAYNLVSYDEVSEMVFEAREDYNWGRQANIQTVVYRIIGDPTAAVQAIANEEIDVFQPQATADILQQIEALADRGVVAITGDGATYEHVDLVFDNGGPFDPATYGGDEEVAKMVRQAFLLTIPRQEIVDRLIKPLNPNAEIRNSFTTVPGAPEYDNIVANNGSADYEQDLERAAQLLADAGVSTPIDVRFHFADNNPRRANEYDLISAAAAEVGFNVIDGRSATWGPELANNSIYDASLFGWISTAVDIAGTNANFVTGGANNYGHYSSEVVDELYAELQGTADPARQQEILLEIEQNLWGDAFGTTIFQFPEVIGYNSTYVDGITSIPLSPQVFWDIFNWSAA